MMSQSDRATDDGNVSDLSAPADGMPVLVCDHAGGDLAALPEALENLGIPCDYAVDAHQDPPDLPDPALLVVSAELPGGPSGDIFRRLRKRYPAPPLVAVARTRSFSLAVSFWRAGAADYLALPLDPAETVARLAPLLRRTPPASATASAEDPEDVVVEWSPGNLADVILAARPSAAPPAAATPSAKAGSAGATAKGRKKSRRRAVRQVPEKPSAPVPVSASAPSSPTPPALPEEDILARLDRLDDVSAWMSGMPCGVVVLTREGAAAYANAVALSLLGASDAAAAARLMGDGWTTLEAAGRNGKPIPPASRPTAQAERDKAPRAATARIRRGDGTRLWLRIECAPWRDRERVAGVVAVLTNVTDACASRPSP